MIFGHVTATFIIGSVYIWCPETSARALAQNVAVFRYLVPSLKICSHSINRTHAHHGEILGKVPGNPRKAKHGVYTRTQCPV